MGLSVQIGSLSGSQYDFTKMTDAELLSASRSLRSEGKISVSAEAELMGIASGVDTYDPNSHGNSVAQSLADATEKNFLGYLRQQYDSSQSAAVQGNDVKGSELYLDTLRQLENYQMSSTARSDQSLFTVG